MSGASPPVPTGGVPRVNPSHITKASDMLRRPLAGIGDVFSTAPGSAARYNTGKAPLELLPLRCMHAYYYSGKSATIPRWQLDALAALSALAEWQERGSMASLVDVLHHLGDSWTECAEVFDYGRKKYAEWNWAKGFSWSVPLACAARHLRSILDGEEEIGRAHV